jgi:hypothetical protein
MRKIATAAAAIALGACASSAQAATDQARMSAQFRHWSIHRLVLATDTPAGYITTSCLRRRVGVWDCGAVVWNPQYGVYGGVVDEVLQFRFKRAAGASGYDGPHGAHWKGRIPGVARAVGTRRLHMNGVITGVSFGKPQ